jgi:hypothetical protein
MSDFDNNDLSKCSTSHTCTPGNPFNWNIRGNRNICKLCVSNIKLMLKAERKMLEVIFSSLNHHS